MVQYHSISNATLSTVLNSLETYNVGAGQIVQIYYDGTNHVAIYVTN